MFFSFLLFLACSPSLPEAQQVLARAITTESEGHIKLVGFSVTGDEAAGAEARRISYEAEIAFDENGVWCRGVDKSLRSTFAPNPVAADGKRSAMHPRMAPGGMAQIAMDLQGERLVVQNEHVRISGVMLGKKNGAARNYGLDQSRLAD